MFSKVDVNGKDAHPVYQWLRQEQGGLMGDRIKWNFTKFLVGRDGKVIGRYGSTTKPEKLADDIENALASDPEGSRLEIVLSGYPSPMRFSDEAVLRLVVAVLLGAVVGIERELKDQPAGLRTHIAVCLGAAAFGVVSTLGFTEFEARRDTTNVQIDVTRVASQVVVGIGFLGAGVIFRERTSVRNLTTAASLWVTAAIGLLAGVGDLGTAAAASALLLVVLVALRPLRTFLRRRAQKPIRDLTLRLVAEADAATAIAGLHGLEGVEVSRLRLGKVDGAPTLTFRIEGRPGEDLEDVVALLVAQPDVEDLQPGGEPPD